MYTVLVWCADNQWRRQFDDRDEAIAYAEQWGRRHGYHARVVRGMP